MGNAPNRFKRETYERLITLENELTTFANRLGKRDYSTLLRVRPERLDIGIKLAGVKPTSRLEIGEPGTAW
jgi:hypothetical protein